LVISCRPVIDIELVAKRSSLPFGSEIVLLAAATASLLSGVAAAERILPTPTGEYGVGRTAFRWVDMDRPEVLSTQADDQRQVGIWVWYPVSPQPGEETAPYVEDLDALAGALTETEVSLLQSVRTHSVAAVALAPEPATFPVLLLSPGMATIPALYTSFAEELASHGYIIAVVDHPYDSAATLLSDGRVVEQARQPDGGEELLTYMRERTAVRVEDVAFVMRRLIDLHEGAVASPFRARLNLSRMGVLGHSIGGMTAAEACMHYERIRACANMDGVVNAMPAYPDADGRGPPQPFLFLAKPLPAVPGESQEDSQRRLSLLYSRGNTVLDDVLLGRSYRVTITGATHATFSDEEFLLADESESPRELLGFARAYLLAFFDENLRGLSPTLLDAPPIDNAIRLETFMP
jgi:dienelactone hydrolase